MKLEKIAEVILGFGVIALTVGDTPAIPDEIIGVPLGSILIADGFGVKLW